MPGDGEIHVWGVGTARTIRVHWTLAELGLDYVTHEIVPRTASMQDPAFLAISRRGKVPILQVGDLVMGESGAIAAHLADRHRETLALCPAPATRERAVHDDLCLYALTELDAALYVVRRHEGLPDVYGEAPTAVRAAKAYFLRQAAEMERRLEDGRPWLLGDVFSVADVLLASCSVWAGFVGVAVPDLLARHQARATAREAYPRAAAVNFPPAALEMLARDRASAELQRAAGSGA